MKKYFFAPAAVIRSSYTAEGIEVINESTKVIEITGSGVLYGVTFRFFDPIAVFIDGEIFANLPFETTSDHRTGGFGDFVTSGGSYGAIIQPTQFPWLDGKTGTYLRRLAAPVWFNEKVEIYVVKQQVENIASIEAAYGIYG